MTVTIVDEPGLRGLAADMADALPAGAVIALEGPLGAGKTTFAQAFARARGATVEATSPTYTLAHRYAREGGDVWHLDCYRLRDPDEAQDLDWETLVQGNALLVEWPDRAGSWLPQPTVRVQLDHHDDTHRTVVVTRE